MNSDGGKDKKESLSIGMKVSAAEVAMFDVMVAREKQRAGRFEAGVSKAGMLRRWFLEAAKAEGLTPDMFKDAHVPETPRPPAATPAAAAPAEAPPQQPAEPISLDEGVRAALKRARDAGLSLDKIAEEAEIQRPRLGEFQRGSPLPFNNERLPDLAAALGRLGHPVGQRLWMGR